MWPYGDDDAALTDALRLSRGMTLKSALAEMPFGGGKSIVIGDPARDKSPELWRAMGRFVKSLGGRYVIAEDVGTRPVDMEIIRRETRFVARIEKGGSGDPSPATAWGVFMGIKAALETRLGNGDPSGVRVAVQGLGHVARIHGTLLTIFERAKAQGIATNEAANRIARDRIQAVNTV